MERRSFLSMLFALPAIQATAAAKAATGANIGTVEIKSARIGEINAIPLDRLMTNEVDHINGVVRSTILRGGAVMEFNEREGTCRVVTD